MRRTTISLPEELADALEREARRRRVPVSKVAREAIEERLGRRPGGVKQLPFVALGHSGHSSTARDIDDILDSEWTVDRNR
ncbi:MAG: ribbon-helix-helix protein, CopG family [Chloroflexota bacterium]